MCWYLTSETPKIYSTFLGQGHNYTLQFDVERYKMCRPLNLYRLSLQKWMPLDSVGG